MRRDRARHGRRRRFPVVQRTHAAEQDLRRELPGGVRKLAQPHDLQNEPGFWSGRMESACKDALMKLVTQFRRPFIDCGLRH